jgi:uncharacterized protein (TIGR03084 family)
MPGPSITTLVADLSAEHDSLDTVVSHLRNDEWSRSTPAEGWDIRDTISHLTYFDENATLAIVDPDRFAADSGEFLANPVRPTNDVDLGRALTPQGLLERWRSSRTALIAAISECNPARRIPWYGPPMSLASFTTARIMETWAHGQDIVDTVGADPAVSDRLRHVIHIGVGARPYAYMVNGLEDPGTPVRVETTGPSGDPWAWGPEDAENRVTGSALDLALVLTRRRHLDDTDVAAEGQVATEWIGIAQTFAGPPGPTRSRGAGT